MAIMPSVPNSAFSHSGIEGVPSTLIFIKTIPLSANSFSAWTKYLESVHSAAFFLVTTSVPAEPVKPETHFLQAKYS